MCSFTNAIGTSMKYFFPCLTKPGKIQNSRNDYRNVFFVKPVSLYATLPQIYKPNMNGLTPNLIYSIKFVILDSCYSNNYYPPICLEKLWKIGKIYSCTTYIEFSICTKVVIHKSLYDLQEDITIDKCFLTFNDKKYKKKIIILFDGTPKGYNLKL